VQSEAIKGICSTSVQSVQSDVISAIRGNQRQLLHLRACLRRRRVEQRRPERILHAHGLQQVRPTLARTLHRRRLVRNVFCSLEQLGEQCQIEAVALSLQLRVELRHLQSVAISGNQWHSVAISGNQWQSVAIISGNQWH